MLPLKWSRRSVTMLVRREVQMAFDSPAEIVPPPRSKGAPLGLFGIPGLHTPEDLRTMAKQAKDRVDELTQTVVASRAGDGARAIRMLDDLSEAATLVTDIAQALRAVHPHREFAQAAEMVFMDMSNTVSKLNINTQIAKVVDSIVDQGKRQPSSLSTEELASAVVLQSDFTNSGIHLPSQERDKFVALSEQVLQLCSTLFEEPSIDVPHVQKLPPYFQRIVKNFRMNAAGVVSIPTSLSGQLLAAVPDEEVRRTVYLAAYKSKPARLDMLDRLLASRHKVATLAGSSSYAALFLSDKMTSTPEKVFRLVESMGDALRDKAQANLDLLLSAKRQLARTPIVDHVAEWDKSFLINHVQDQMFDTRSLSLTSYFSLGNCMAGIDLLTRSLYGLELRPVAVEPSEVWASCVTRLDVVEMDTNKLIGHIYCDFGTRASKNTGAAHYTVRCSKSHSPDESQTPIVLLTCSFEHQAGEQVQLNFDEMEVLFHEMGHALHSMLARTQMHMLSGTRCKLDFVETPSILMEYFARDYRVVSKFAHHYKTGAVLPQPLFQRFLDSRDLFNPLNTQMQVVYGLMDQKFHGPHPLSSSTTSIVADLQEKYTGVPISPGTAWHTEFIHLSGYAAGYYAYLQCRVFAAHIWNKVFSNDPFSRDAGERYRTAILLPGGSKDPALMLRDLLDEDPSLEHLRDPKIF